MIRAKDDRNERIATVLKEIVADNKKTPDLHSILENQRSASKREDLVSQTLKTVIDEMKMDMDDIAGKNPDHIGVSLYNNMPVKSQYKADTIQTAAKPLLDVAAKLSTAASVKGWGEIDIPYDM